MNLKGSTSAPLRDFKPTLGATEEAFLEARSCFHLFSPDTFIKKL